MRTARPSSSSAGGCACTYASTGARRAFSPLGLAKASGRPVAVVTTSGTATANHVLAVSGRGGSLRRTGVLYGSELLTEPVVAAAVVGASPSLLFVGSSKPVRDLFVASPGPSARVLANRGVAGIDGSVSTALGAALAHQADGGGVAYALLGDLSFLHDANGLLLGPQEARPDLTIVVVNNDGGAIFGLLEQAGEAYTDAFERLFGTPHGVELAALCAATGTPHFLAATWEDLHAALLPAGGIRVVEVRTDRFSAITLDRALHHAVAEALGR